MNKSSNNTCEKTYYLDYDMDRQVSEFNTTKPCETLRSVYELIKGWLAEDSNINVNFTTSSYLSAKTMYSNIQCVKCSLIINK